MVKIVHTADMHFDSPFAALPMGVARLRKEELLGTFQRMIDFIKENNVEILLIAGDVFDSNYVSSDTLHFLKQSFAQIPDVGVFISPGNHDFLYAESPYKTVNFGANVFVFSQEFEKVTFKGIDIYGCGFSSRYCNNSLLPSDFRHEGENPGILLMHGEIGANSDYNPVWESLLENSLLSYAAFGHIHAYSGIQSAGKTRYAYSGTPEGRYFDEGNVCGFIYGEISEDNMALSFVPIAKRQNITLEIDVTDAGSIDAIIKKVKENISVENLYKIILYGNISEKLYIDTALLQKELSDSCLYIKIKDSTNSLYDGAEESYLEKLFIDKLKGQNDEIALLAIKYGLEALRRTKP